MLKICISLLLCISLLGMASEERVPVVVETLLKSNRLILLSKHKVDLQQYDIYEENKKIGSITVVRTNRAKRFDEYRYEIVADYSVENDALLTAGTKIELTRSIEAPLPRYKDSFGKESEDYQKRIKTATDQSEMVLVSGGVTLIGSDLGGEDEKPVHQIVLDTFYIDKYEVSNRQFLRYVKASKQKPPSTWHDGHFPQKFADYPAIVSYHEAQAYAKWAGKRLPTEFEWERAANGVLATQRIITDDGILYKPFKTRFSWGNEIDPSASNYKDFWLSTITSEIQKKFEKGYLPVYFLEEKSSSFYGAVNMCGNAAEWTSSWYKAYPESEYSHIRFGEQVKVVRGGAFYSTPDQVTTASRSYGGLPNLYTDSRAGFRCVKEPNENDRLSPGE